MKGKERISCSVGNVFNDLFRQLLFSFGVLFFMKVLELSASQAGLILLIAQVSDAFMSPVTGYLGDNVNVLFLSNKIGRRKSWHLVATVLMAISIPLLFNECFLCDGRDPSWLSLVYFGFFSGLVAVCFNVVEINHLAFITTVAENVDEFTKLTAMRTMLSFLSGVYVYAIAWAFLGKDSGDNLGPNNLSGFESLSLITTGTGVFFAIIFYIGRKEPKKRVRKLRKLSTYVDFAPNISGLYMGSSRKTSLAHSFVSMFVASSTDKQNHEEETHCTADHGKPQRKRSLLFEFVDMIFYQEETLENKQRDTSSQINNREMTEDSQNKLTRQQLIREVQHLDRDRKKSLLMRFIDRLLSRPDLSQEELSTGNIEDHVAVDSANEECTTDENHLREERLQTIDKETGDKRIVDTVKDGHEMRDLEIDQEDNVQTKSILAKPNQRKNGVSSIFNDGRVGVLNLGFAFDYEGSEETEKDCSSDTSGALKPKRSVTFSLSEFPVLSLMDGEEEKKFEIDESIEKSTAVAVMIQRGREKEDDFDEDENPSVSKDTLPHEVLSVPVSPPNDTSKGGRPKSVKDWLRDPNLYKVAIIFTCSRLVQGTAYTYLPLLLTERLHFAKEAIAYFSLVLLISASLSSMLCEILVRRIGTKWSYLLAASLVMGGSVWSYFLTPSTKQTTYAPVVIIGCGMSIMYVMALAFITELIGENKENSGSVISIITIIARLSSGGLVFGIQEFYPEQDTNSNEVVGNYVQHVFAMTLGILTLVGFLLVLFFQPSELICRKKESKPENDIEAQAVDKDESPPDSVSSDVNQNTTLATVHSFYVDTKL